VISETGQLDLRAGESHGTRNACDLPEAKMHRPYTLKEKARVILGAAVALIVVGWIAVIAIAATSVR
jgi:hypothetical protein